SFLQWDTGVAPSQYVTGSPVSRQQSDSWSAETFTASTAASVMWPSSLPPGVNSVIPGAGWQLFAGSSVAASYEPMQFCDAESVPIVMRAAWMGRSTYDDASAVRKIGTTRFIPIVVPKLPTASGLAGTVIGAMVSPIRISMSKA